MFNKYPTLGYISDGRIVNVVDIFRRVAVIQESLNNYNIEYYTIQDGEQPEDVAYKLYGNGKLGWTILIVNNILDPYNEWYLSGEILEDYVVRKYGANFLNTHHHWVLPERPEICVEYNAAKLASGEIVPVTNYEHEVILNDGRREIKVISPNNIRDFVKEFENLIRL